MAEKEITKRRTRLKDISGKRFARLLVIRRSDLKGGKPRWECACDCGNAVIVIGGNLTNGHTRSCGCLQSQRTSESHLKHGFSDTVEYHAWRSAMKRCTDPIHPEYQRYGGRGITMSDRWTASFEAFLADMGPRPSGMTLDRIDNDGPYTGPCHEYPNGNCRWATIPEQNRNKRATIRITHHGETLSLREWSHKLGIHYSTLHKRYETGRPLFVKKKHCLTCTCEGHE